LCPELEKVIETVINIVNYIKTRPLKARIARLHEEMGAEYIPLNFIVNQCGCLKGMFYKCSDCEMNFISI
jgi:hypothetical protein